MRPDDHKNSKELNNLKTFLHNLFQWLPEILILLWVLISTHKHHVRHFSSIILWLLN